MNAGPAGPRGSADLGELGNVYGADDVTSLAFLPLDRAAHQLDPLADAAQAQAMGPGRGVAAVAVVAQAQLQVAVAQGAFDADLVRLGVGDDVADQLAQDPGERGPLHDAEGVLLVEFGAPLELATGGQQALRDVGLPLGGGQRQRVFLGGQAAGQGLQVLQGVADVVLHLLAGGLVHQGQQAGADVVVQVLGDAGALFAAAALDRPVVGQGAHELLADAVRQAGVLGG